ncbi:MAG: hypothetical protein NC340_07565 [Ruminococcus flavefaciens]|nr:hypothetical protein [Ruminococcus flavefaciens]MCM1229359.1 hypothetical protein [Ruminococcus flavefaciens]
MKNKIFTVALVLSAVPYHAVFIIPAVATIRVLSQYGFFSTFAIYFLATLLTLGAVFPVIPLSVGFHTGIIVNLMLKKLNISKKTAVILSVIFAVIIFSLLTIFLLKILSQWDSL